MSDSHKEDHRSRKSQKLIYELIMSRMLAEQSALIHEAKKYEKMDSSGKESFDNRLQCLFEIGHALTWFVDKIICDRRR